LSLVAAGGGADEVQMLALTFECVAEILKCDQSDLMKAPSAGSRIIERGWLT